jgi:hypothetical protein
VSIRCGCLDEADDIVFGPSHRCSKPQDATPGWVWTLDAQERPHERVLSEDERCGY